MSGRQAKRARRNGEALSIEARRAEQEFARLVRRRFDELGERRARRRELVRRAFAFLGLALFVAAMLAQFWFVVLQ